MRLLNNTHKKIIPFVINVIFVSVFYAHAEGDYNTLDQLAEVVKNIFSILFYASAAIFVAMIAYGVWKSSMALGDPRGLEAAKSAWSYALYGFFVVLFCLTIVLVIGGLFGKQGEFSGGVEGVIQSIFDALDELISVPGQESL